MAEPVDDSPFPHCANYEQCGEHILHRPDKRTLCFRCEKAAGLDPWRNFDNPSSEK